LGYRIIRFTGTEIYKDVNKCVKEVLELKEIPGNTVKKIIEIPREENKKDNSEKINRQTKSTKKEIKTINYIPANNDNYKRKNYTASKLNNKQITTIGVLTILALCSGCFTVSTVIKIIGK
jgi:hypothetical protein